MNIITISPLLLFLVFAAPRALRAEPPLYQVLHEGTGVDVGNTLMSPLAIFFDTQRDECYVADTGNNQIVIFDKNGIPLHRFYHHVTRRDERVLGEPRGIVVDKEGRMFVTDSAAPYLDVLDALGRPIVEIEPPEDACNAFESFEHVTLAPDGRVYATVTCKIARKVAIINSDLEIERVVILPPMEGSPPCMSAIAVDASERIYIVEPCAETMIQIYDKDANYVMGFGHHDTGTENFSLPVGIVVMPNGDMWIVDTLRQIASHFSPKGTFVNYIGGKGRGPGSLFYPSGIATDGEDRLFVVEKAGNRYQCFKLLTETPSKPDGEKEFNAVHSNTTGGR